MTQLGNVLMTIFSKIRLASIGVVMFSIASAVSAQTLAKRYIDNSAEITRFNMACQAIRPHLNVRVDKIANVKIDQSWGTEKITAYDASIKAVPEGAIVWGITEATYNSQLSHEVKSITSDSLGVSCAVPGIDLVLGYEALDIKIAKELVLGLCAYNYVLAHEMEHITIYQENIYKMRDNLAVAFEAKLRGKVFVGSNKDNLIFQATEYTQSFLEGLLKVERAKIQALQAKLDTPEEYAKADGVCAGGLSKRLTARGK